MIQLQPYNGVQTGGFIQGGIPSINSQTGLRSSNFGIQPYGGGNQQMWMVFSQMLNMMNTMMTGMMKLFQGMLGQSSNMLGTNPGIQPSINSPFLSQPEVKQESSFGWLKDLGAGLFDIGKDILGGGLDKAVSIGSKIFKGIKSLF